MAAGASCELKLIQVLSSNMVPNDQGPTMTRRRGRFSRSPRRPVPPPARPHRPRAGRTRERPQAAPPTPVFCALVVLIGREGSFGALCLLSRQRVDGVVWIGEENNTPFGLAVRCARGLGGAGMAWRLGTGRRWRGYWYGRACEIAVARQGS